MLEVSYPLSVIDRTLAAFVCEARQADGKPYPGSTLKNILSALFRVMKQFQGAQNVTNFVDKTEREKHFPQLHNALDRVLRQLRQSGIGVECRRAALITDDIESKLWETGVTGIHSPQALLHAVFFYNGKYFYLWGIGEHQNLRFSQIAHTSPTKYTYLEFGSKNHSGGVSNRSKGKVVSIVGTNSPSLSGPQGHTKQGHWNITVNLQRYCWCFVWNVIVCTICIVSLLYHFPPCIPYFYCCFHNTSFLAVSLSALFFCALLFTDDGSSIVAETFEFLFNFIFLARVDFSIFEHIPQ